jgi:hypothetical protein
MKWPCAIMTQEFEYLKILFIMEINIMPLTSRDKDVSLKKNIMYHFKMLLLYSS